MTLVTCPSCQAVEARARYAEMQRDDLLAALKRIADYPCPGLCVLNKEHDCPGGIARAALTKAEGGAR